MRLLPADERGLRRALELASDAQAFASPNPTVGCVLMRSETVLGEGAHFYDNFDHAEIAALKQARAAGPHWLTGPAAREDVQRLRHASDAILTGIGTVLADDPELTDRTGLPRRRPLLRAVMDPELRIPLESKLVRSVAAEGKKDLLV